MNRSSVKFGYFVVLEHYEVHEAIRQAILAERCGFNSIFLSDHFHPWHERGEAAMAWPVMAAIAERTKRIAPISTNVTCPTIRYNPAVVAQTFATLSVMYPRRIALGVGSGEAMNEFPATGSWPSPSKRLDMLVEAVKLIRLLWENENAVSFNGRYFRTYAAKLYTKPTGKIPLYFAAAGLKACELAGRYGDHWITNSTTPERLRSLTIPAFEKGAKEAGKNPAEMEKVLAVDFAIDRSLDSAIEACRPFAGSLVPAIFKYKVYDPKEIEEHARIVSKETIMKSFIVATSADGLIDKLEDFANVGIDHFALVNLSPNIDESMKTMAEKVIPYFKSESQTS